MKPKIYPSSITGKEFRFIQEYLLNKKDQLKSAAINPIPQHLKLHIRSNARSRGLENDSDITECLYWIVHNLYEYPKNCSVCGNYIKTFHSFTKGYPHSRCSTKCSNNDKSVQDKKKQSSLKKYGTEFPWQSSNVKNKSRKTFVDGWFEERFSQFLPEYEPMTTKQEFRGSKIKFTWKHNCGNIFTELMQCRETKPMCPACRDNLNISRQQRDITDYVKTLYDGIIINNDRRTVWPLELDIYLLEKKIAIEYHGLYWHSYDRKETKDEKNKHVNKVNSCEEKGIKLIQIWEHEWLEQQNIVKSRLKSILGVDEKIFARKCVIRHVPQEESLTFQKNVHIQGKTGSSVKLGLYLNDKLVALMTFGKPRMSRKYEWELIRYCSVGTIVGGASRLMFHFIKTYQPKSIVTYADRRWSSGNMYFKLGFVSIDKSSPNYFYFRDNKRYKRYAFQKHRLSNVLEVFDPKKSEQENAFMNGYRRAWDAGNHVMVWTVPEP